MWTDGTHFGIRYRRRTGGFGMPGGYYWIDDLSYLVKGSTDDMATWFWGPMSLSLPPGQTVNNGDGTETVTTIITAPVGSLPRGRGVLQLRVE